MFETRRSESLLNMQGFASWLIMVLSFCEFAMFVLPLYYFFGLSWGSLGPLTASERQVTIHRKYAGIGVLAPYDFSIWPFSEFLESALLLLGGPWASILAPEEPPTAPSGSPGALMARQMAPRSQQGSSEDVFGPIF